MKRDDLDKLLDLYKVESPYREELQALASESTKIGRLRAVIAGLPTDYAEYVSAEDEARSIWNWEPLIVPGLLQTEDYTRAVIAGYQSMFRLPPGTRKGGSRSAACASNCSPGSRRCNCPSSSTNRCCDGDLAVIDYVCTIAPGNRSFRNAKCGHQGAPLGGEHPTTTGAFSYMQFPQVHDVPLRDIVSVEHLTGSVDLEDEEQTFRFRVTFEGLLEKSLDPSESRDLIIHTAGELWT